MALRAGDEDEARRRFRETLRRYVELDEIDGVANSLDGRSCRVTTSPGCCSGPRTGSVSGRASSGRAS
ncbi:MAG TPA: hypothetical protein VNL94_08065 [Candidatus Binatia bacterium]|nr:hypothetical protein [Candidatus Binatia bacterium]